MKLAIHRSITFWSGIVVMVFIGWAWWDSMRFISHAWHDPYEGTSAGGGVCVGNTGGPGFGTPRSGKERYPLAGYPSSTVALFVRDKNISSYEWGALMGRAITDETAVFTMEEYLKLTVSSSSPTGRWLLFVPYWIILVAVSVPWTALLIGRARRRKPVVPLTSGGGA